MKKRQEIDKGKLLHNPFTSSLLIEATRLTESNVFILDEKGEKVPIKKLIEKQKSTKIYHCTGCKERVYSLSPGAKSLYLYILYNIESSKDWIAINREWYMRKNNVKSVNTYKDAMKELARYEFITPTAEYRDVFWINPALFFAGNRIRKYPENVRIDNDWFKTN